MTGEGLLLSIALPAEQQGDPVRVPVEIRYVLSARLEDAPLVAEDDQQSWCSARGSYEFRTTMTLLNDLLEASVCGSTVMGSTIYNGVAMWQFLPALLWGQVFLVAELVDAIAGIVDGNPVDELRVFPAQGPAADVWNGVTRGVSESRGIPHTVLPDALQQPEGPRAFVRSVLMDGPLGLGVRWTRSSTRWIWPRASRLTRDLTLPAAARPLHRGRARSRGGRKLLFASVARHWTADPANAGRKYDEQFYPILPALREAGWTCFVGVDCPYRRDEASLGERVQSADRGVTWHSYDSFRARSAGVGDRSRPAFAQMLMNLLDDHGFTSALTYRGVPLVPVMKDRLGEAFLRTLPSCVQALDTAGRILDKEAPDAVMVTYETGQYAMALLIEADRRGIPTVGLQHGMIYDDHNSYMHPSVTTNPVLDTSGIAIPKKTLVWGPLWARILTEVGHYPRDAVAVTGNWRHDSVLTKRNEIRLSFRRELGLDAASRVVLVLGSGFNLVSYVDRCLCAISTIQEAVPLIKLHPALDTAPIRSLIQDSGLAESTLAPDRMAAAILASDLVVSQPSTAVSEALLLGRPVVIVDFEGAAPTAEGRPDTDGCLYVTEPAGLLAAIRSALDDPMVIRALSIERDSAVADHFFRADGMAASRVAVELEKLVAPTRSPTSCAPGQRDRVCGQA